MKDLFLENSKGYGEQLQFSKEENEFFISISDNNNTISICLNIEQIEQLKTFLNQL
jgi:hypothetical protein